MASSDLQELKVLLQVRDREFARALTKNTQRIDRFAKQSNRSLSKTTRGFNKMAVSMRSLIPALGAAVLIAKVKRVTAELDEIGKTADNLGLTTDALQELRVVAESSGMSFDEFTKAFQKFTVGVGEATDGSGTARDAFEKLGVSIMDSAGNIKSSERLFDEAADALQGFANESERAGIAADLFGARVGVKMLNLLRNGSDGMAEMREEARKLGVVIDEDLIRKAEASQTELDLLARVLNAQVSTALINLAPLIADAGRLLGWLATKASEAYQGFQWLYNIASQDAGLGDQWVEATTELDNLESKLAGLNDQLGYGQGMHQDLLARQVVETTAALEAQRVKAGELFDAYMAMDDVEIDTPTTPDTPQGPDGGGLESMLERGNARIAQLRLDAEMSDLSTEAAARRRLEIEAGVLGQQLMNEALASGGEVTVEEAEQISALVTALLDEADAAGEVEIAQRSATGARREGTDAANEQERAMEELQARNMQLGKDFIDAAMNADTLKDALNGVLKMALKLAATSFLQGLFGVAPANQTGLGSLFSGLGAGLNGRASGGPVSAGSPYMVGENGPEPFIPAQNGRILSVSQAKSAVAGGDGGGGQPIVMNINVTTGVQDTVKAEIVGMLPQIEQVAKRAVLDANQRGGHFRKSLMGG